MFVFWHLRGLFVTVGNSVACSTGRQGLLLAVAWGTLSWAPAVAREPAAPVDFSRHVRPLLSDKCFRCHGPDADSRKAELRLDRREAAIAAGALVPGKVDESALVARISTADPELKMPPPESKLRLTDEEVALLKQWVAAGADYDAHWAFTPPVRPPLPTVGDKTWAKNPIDLFVLAKLESLRLTPSPPADLTSRVRRLHLDLIGLPPTPREVDDVLQASHPELALAERVAALLKSPHFGERWARWWLDAARYADSDGYEKDKQRSVWFYRDWVIRALNADKPYRDFIIEQIAGDLLPGAGQAERVATGFLRNSMVNEEGGADPEQFRVEGMFDRIDAIGKAVLGLTTQCAQCHSHKYDPLSQREYYQLFAALNDFHEATLSVYTEKQQQARRRLLANVAALEAEAKQRVPQWESQLADWETRQTAALSAVPWTTLVPTDRPYEGQKFRLLEDGSIVSESYAPTKANNTFRLRTDLTRITAFRLDLLTHPQLPRGGPGRSIYGTGALSELELTVTRPGKDAQPQKVKFARAMADVNPQHSLLPDAFRERDPSKDKRVTGPVEYAIDGDPKTAWTTATDPGRRNRDFHAVFVLEEPLEVAREDELAITLRQLHGGWNSDDNQNYLLGRYRFSATGAAQLPDTSLPSEVATALRTPRRERTPEQTDALFAAWRASVPALADLTNRIEALWKQHPQPHSQLVAHARPEPRETFVMLRGDFLAPGEPVAPAAPEFLNPWHAGAAPARLQLARWLVADDSPTTARVIVNRLWQAYFGAGLVTTPEDFGRQSALPSHPGLLDWLAVELMEHNWSLKHIHQLIVNSATYQQSAVVTEELLRRDPANQWLARGPRVRVDAELVRDLALAASGLLDRRIGGPSVYPPAPSFLFQPPASYGPKQWPTSAAGTQYRRSLYIHSYRSVPYPALQVFDAPKGDAACVRRERSNTPLQALVLLNEPQFVDAARALAARVLREAEHDDQQRLQYAHRLCVSRRPTPRELAILQRLLQQQRERIARGELDLATLLGVSPERCLQLSGHAAEDLAPWFVVARVLLNLDETITKP